MLKHFIKYQSLGNDFVLFDWYKKPDVYIKRTLNNLPDWKQFIVQVCKRNYGIGANGLLVLKSNQESRLPEMLIFNADGSSAEICLNGLRCVAHYLFTQYHCSPEFKVLCGDRFIECQVAAGKLTSQKIIITTNVGAVSYDGFKTIDTSAGLFEGHIASVGNPHFVIFKEYDVNWLKNNGALIEAHSSFENKTNVEFVWQTDSDKEENKKYSMLVYERGCDVTLACSSGAAAVLGVLYQCKQIEKNEKVSLKMAGGVVEGP